MPKKPMPKGFWKETFGKAFDIFLTRWCYYKINIRLRSFENEFLDIEWNGSWSKIMKSAVPTTIKADYVKLLIKSNWSQESTNDYGFYKVIFCVSKKMKYSC